MPRPTWVSRARNDSNLVTTVEYFVFDTSIGVVTETRTRVMLHE